VFTSDNGARGDHGGSNAPLRGRKGTTWEGGQRVPCIMYWPGVIPPGSVSSEPVSAMDFLPTFCSLAGVRMPDDRIIDGNVILPFMFGESDTKVRRKPFFFYARNELEAVRSGPWKLHVRKRSQKVRELYNLEEDICETHNVYGEEPETVRYLQGCLDRCREDLGDEAVDAPGANCRPIGRVDNPKPLTRYEQDYPYIIAEYDLEDRG
jgi:arylsulfatase A